MFCDPNGHSTFQPLTDEVYQKLGAALQPSESDPLDLRGDPGRITRILQGAGDDFVERQRGEEGLRQLEEYRNEVRDKLNVLAAETNDTRFSQLAEAVGTPEFNSERLLELGVFNKDESRMLRDGNPETILRHIVGVECIESEAAELTGGPAFNEVNILAPSEGGQPAAVTAAGRAFVDPGALRKYGLNSLQLPDRPQDHARLQVAAIANENFHLEENRLFTGEPADYNWNNVISFPGEFQRAGRSVDALDEYITVSELGSDATSIGNGMIELATAKIARYLQNEMGEANGINRPQPFDRYHLAHRTIFNKANEILGIDGEEVVLAPLREQAGAIIREQFSAGIEDTANTYAKFLIESLNPEERQEFIEFFQEEAERITEHMREVYSDPSRVGPR